MKFTFVLIRNEGVNLGLEKAFKNVKEVCYKFYKKSFSNFLQSLKNIEPICSI